MKKRIKSIGFIFLLLILVYMTNQRPTEEQFYIWLKNQHNISCDGNVTCTMYWNNEQDVRTVIETGSFVKQGYLIFNTISKTYEDQFGNQTEIKAIGMFNHYFTIVKD